MNAFMLVGYALACSALCAVLAVCAELACESRRVQQRWVWVIAIALSVAVPLSTLVRRDAPPAPAAEIVPLVPVSVASEAPRTTQTGPAGVVELPMLRPAPTTASEVPVRASAIMAAEPFVRAVLWGSLGVVPLLLLVEWARLRRMRRVWRHGSLNGVHVLVSERFGPAVVGVLDPRIVVPQFVGELAPTAQALLLAHEQEHVRAHDSRVALATLSLIALAPWNPLLWWQFARLRQAIELDCDARVLRRTKADHEYGALLLDIAARAPRTMLVATAFLETARTSLERRIARIAQTTRRISRGQWMMLGAIGAAATLVFSNVPRPSRPAQVRTAANFVADSGADALTALLQTGYFARAESIGKAFLVKWPPEQHVDESCRVLILVAFAELRLGDRDGARASIARFDRECQSAAQMDFFPAVSNSVRRAVLGKDAVDPARRYTEDGSMLVSSRPSLSQVMQLLRAGHYATASRAGRAYFESLDRHIGATEECSIQLAIALADAAQSEREDARRALARFERDCATTALSDSITFTIADVRRVADGEALEHVVPALAVPQVAPDRGAIEVRWSNLHGFYEDAITIGRAYLGSGHQLGEPEACAVQIGVTYALTLQERFVEARIAMTQFDRSCRGVRYNDWFPTESDRVRRIVNGEPPDRVYGIPGPRAVRGPQAIPFTKWGLPAMPYEPYWRATQRFTVNRR